MGRVLTNSHMAIILLCDIDFNHDGQNDFAVFKGKTINYR